MAVLVADSKLENFLSLLDAKVASTIEKPQQGNSEVAGPPRSAKLQALKDGGKVLLAKQADANRDVHLGVQYIFFLQALHEAVRD